jgi:hypothetical protein
VLWIIFTREDLDEKHLTNKNMKQTKLDLRSPKEVAETIKFLEELATRQTADTNRLYAESQISLYKNIQEIPDDNTPENLIKLLSLRIKLHQNRLHNDLVSMEVWDTYKLPKETYRDMLLQSIQNNMDVLGEVTDSLYDILDQNTKKTFNLELTKEELLNSKGEVFMTNYLGLVIEGEEIRPQTLNYRIRLTDREFPIILKGSKFVSITECREGERFYTPSTNPEILKFLIND